LPGLPNQFQLLLFSQNSLLTSLQFQFSFNSSHVYNPHPAHYGGDASKCPFAKFIDSLDYKNQIGGRKYRRCQTTPPTATTTTAKGTATNLNSTPSLLPLVPQSQSHHHHHHHHHLLQFLPLDLVGVGLHFFVILSFFHFVGSFFLGHFNHYFLHYFHRFLHLLHYIHL